MTSSTLTILRHDVDSRPTFTIESGSMYDHILINYIKAFLPRNCAAHFDSYEPLEGDYAKAVAHLSALLNLMNREREHGIDNSIVDVRPLVKAMLDAYTSLDKAKQAEKAKA